MTLYASWRQAAPMLTVFTVTLRKTRWEQTAWKSQQGFNMFELIPIIFTHESILIIFAHITSLLSKAERDVNKYVVGLFVSECTL